MEVSESFGRACIAAGDAFPEAWAQTRTWSRLLQYPDRIAHSIHDARLGERLPEAALELLDQVIGEGSEAYFADLPQCLNAIRAARPKLERDRRFRRLLEVLRINGGDLN